MSDEPEPTTVERVRRRPAMYVGNTSDPPFLVIEEVLSNAFDEYLGGRAHHIEVTLHEDTAVTIADDGRGMARATLEASLTEAHDLATFDSHQPHVHLGGLRGVGIFVVAAVSETFAVETVHAGEAHSFSLARGVATGPVVTVPQTGPTGTKVRFRLDPEIFRIAHVPRAWIIDRLEAVADLSPGLRITLRDEGYELTTPPRGLAQRVRGEHIVEIVETVDDTRVHVALSWWPSFWDTDGEPRVESFVNYSRTPGHGTHVRGLLEGLERVERDLEPRLPLRERLDACVAVVTRDVQWGAPTRDQLRSPLLVPLVRDVVARGLTAHFEQHPAVRAALVDRRRRK